MVRTFGPHEVLVDIENLNAYPESVRNLTSAVVSLFGRNGDTEDFIALGYDFNPDAFQKFLNNVRIEETRFRAISVKDPSAPKDAMTYNVTSNEYYAGELVDVSINNYVAILRHKIDRLD